MVVLGSANLKRLASSQGDRRTYREQTVDSNSYFDEVYRYDGSDRLTGMDRGPLAYQKTSVSPLKFAQCWGLDATGNWRDFREDSDGNGSWDLVQTRTHNPVNEVSDISETSGPAWITPLYDRAGNMTTVPKPSSLANGLTLKYDAWNRVVEVKDGNTVVGKYEYDAAGRRVKRHIDSQSPGSPNGIDRYEHLFYGGAQVIETRGTTNVNDAAQNLQPKYQYVWCLRYIDAPVLRDENTDNDGLCDDARTYFLNDANMNVTSLVDTAGDALERYVYDPYGRVTIYDATWSNTRSTCSYSNTILYTGRDLDPETGLCFYRARYYTAELGRFVGRDPISYISGSASLYHFVLGNPTNQLDPSGLLATTSGDPTANTVVCDGKGGTKIQIGDPNKDKDPWKECGLIECIEKHEQKHKKDFGKACPHLCQGESVGRRISYDDGPGEGAMYEKAAYAVEIECLKAKLYDWHSPRCTKLLEQRIKFLEDYFRDQYTPPPGPKDIMWLPPAEPRCPDDGC